MFKLLVNIIKEHIEYKGQIFKLAKSDLVKTYRGAALGWSWAIIKPTVTIFVYWFAFSIGLRAGRGVNDFPYFLWLISGVVPWFYMSDMITSGTECIRKYNFLVTKMKYPVATIPTFINISKLMIHMMLVAIVLVLFMAFGYKPDIYWLQIPFYTLLTFLFFNFWGILAGPLGAMSKDFSNLVKAFVTAIFWLSGIIWNPETINNVTIKKVLNANPVTFLVNGYRNCLINKVWFWEQPKRLLYFGIIMLLLLFIGLRTYKKVRKDIPDVL